MNITRLANVIFDLGKKVTQSRYAYICESIDNDTFTLDEYVVGYKLKEAFLGKIPFKLEDDTNVLVSESFVQKLSALNIDREKLLEYMSSNYKNFQTITEVVCNGDK